MALEYVAEGVLAEAEGRRALRYVERGSYRAVLLAESSAERRWGDVGEMHGRCTGDAREMYGRCTGDVREI